MEDFDTTFVMAEGRKLQFNCDGKNHYAYIIDKSARKPNGQPYSRGRIYLGTIERVRHEYPAFAAAWETIHLANDPPCKSARDRKGPGSDPGRPEAVGDGGRNGTSSAGE